MALAVRSAAYAFWRVAAHASLGPLEAVDGSLLFNVLLDDPVDLLANNWSGSLGFLLLFDRSFRPCLEFDFSPFRAEENDAIIAQILNMALCVPKTPLPLGLGRFGMDRDCHIRKLEVFGACRRPAIVPPSEQG